MTVPRRVGAETSQTRDGLLDCVEQLMMYKGYAGVTYRAVAAEAGVTPGLVQYYFPRLDDVFTAAIRRRSEQNFARLSKLLERHADRPLRVLWDYSRDESTAALTTEFLALGNRRPSVRAEIAESTERVRQLQLDVLGKHIGERRLSDVPLSPEVLLFLVTGIPKLVRLEEGVGVSSTHKEVVEAVERYLDAVEPGGPIKRGKRRSSKT